METRKLFYEDSHLTHFSATVRSCQETERGFAITLDATAFYPEGGGQACDLGTLNDVQVLDVQEQGEEVVHLCAQSLEVGATVEGRIDWVRRFDLMQQHSGEHIVSGIVCGMLGYHNVGFHVGSEMMEIDFDGPITPEQLQSIEKKANEAVWRNLPIRCWYPSEEELPTVAYRSKKALPWPVRIVEIPGVDSCACCGVHVKNTGEIGLIKILSCVKFHQGVRIELACGSRAYGHMVKFFEENRAISQALSVPMDSTADGTKRLQEALAAEKLRGNQLQSQLLQMIATGYAQAGNVVHFAENLNGNQLRELADAIAKVCGGRAAVLSDSGDQWNICMLHPSGDLTAVIAAMKAAFPTRGGGKPGTFQGTLQATRTQIEAFFDGK